MRDFSDDNFEFHENGRKRSKQVEGTVGKREIARYEQFLLFPQCFQKACFPGASKGVIVWEWVKLKIGINLSKICWQLSAPITWVLLLVVMSLRMFEVNIYIWQHREIAKCQSFCMTMTQTSRLCQYLDGFFNKFFTSKLQEFADDNFKFDENGRTFSK